MKYLCLLTLALLVLTTSARSDEKDTKFYVSAGSSMGYTFGDGFTWGAHVSLGSFQSKKRDSFVPPSIEGPIWGLSAGFKNSKQRTLRFVDAQVVGGEFSAIPFTGLGAGKAWVTSRDTGLVQDYLHLKGWGWLIGVFQGDYYMNKSDSFSALSAGLVLPIPFSL